jgi:CP family cyanate transporter-like MFS transporter
MLAPAPRTSLADTAAPHPILEELLIDTEANRQPPPRPTPPATRGRAVLLALSVVLIAFNLRPVFSSLSVTLPEIMAGSGLSPTGASLLTTLPVLCLGLFAPLAPWLGRRLGLERALLGCMALIVLGTLARGSGSVALLFLASAIAGIGIAINNVLVTVLIKRDFPRRACTPWQCAAAPPRPQA